jgi:hypothetical protein
MQPSIFDVRPSFDGPDVAPTDVVRLSGHLLKVKALMADGRWRSLEEIATVVGCSEASASARLRDLRKIRFGSFTVNRARVADGLWHYQVRS